MKKMTINQQQKRGVDNSKSNDSNVVRVRVSFRPLKINGFKRN
jgi:hypothetical protein